MPAKKTKKQAVKKNTSNLDFQKLIQTSNSYKSLIYGIITVVVLFVVIVLGMRTLSQNQQGDINEGAEISEEMIDNTYTVVEGDTLWSIAEKEYGDGFKWTEIAKENNITNGAIEKGAKLRLPKIARKSETLVVTPKVTQPITKTPTQQQTPTQPTQPKIVGTSYKVVEGDNLWDISVRAYGDGYKWVELARLNNLTNPDLIYVGNVIKLSR